MGVGVRKRGVEGRVCMGFHGSGLASVGMLGASSLEHTVFDEAVYKSGTKWFDRLNEPLDTVVN